MHVIVDNDDIATEIVQRLNREKGGRVTFMPLSRLRNQRVDYPNSPDVVPIMEKINYKPMFRNAFAQVSSLVQVVILKVRVIIRYFFLQKCLSRVRLISMMLEDARL